MDRSTVSEPFYCSSMRTDRAGTVDILLYPKHNGKRRKSYPDAGDRQNIHRTSILWSTTDYRSFARAWAYCQPQACRAIDARDGNSCSGTGPSYQQTTSGTSDLSVSAARKDHHQTERGMVCRYHLYPSPSWLSLSGCYHGLVQPVRTGLDIVEYAGNIVLSRSAGGSLVIGNTGNIQHRSGVSIYGYDMDRSFGTRTDQYQHGRTWARFRQCVHRAVVENAQV